ncbi:hypothetical protein [Cryptosporangium aurantiacum]|uniref:Uncharacterized protein n=1 Tax=Cryptosporangium aurantiacum TaxID=134849 RepID=A0A1M7R6Z9_9ACTN|nr:hypothetical protein [Cryptosporangium aurantiacum]SHN42105.1 hypothetical protein SAMN05443668_10881 [Cryptosporangium aurantiacum]
MYSLVSAPVLGFDLTRIEGGAGVSDVLTRALSLGPDDLEVLAEHRADDGQRADLWAAVEIATTVQPTVRDVAGLSRATDPATPVEKRASAALGLLQRAPLGTVDGLLQCVRYDVLDWTWSAAGEAEPDQAPQFPPVQRTGEPAPRPPKVQSEVASRATAVICDAIVAGYLRQELDDQSRRRLAAPWVAASRRLPEREVGLGPTGSAMRTLIDRVASLSQQDGARLYKAAEAARRESASWAPAIHSASWAVHLADRVREAAAGQFLLVQAVETSGIPVTERAAGVWNLLSGAVQALAARDLVDAETAHRLLGPVLSTLGPSALGS